MHEQAFTADAAFVETLVVEPREDPHGDVAVPRRLRILAAGVLSEAGRLPDLGPDCSCTRTAQRVKRILEKDKLRQILKEQDFKDSSAG